MMPLVMCIAPFAIEKKPSSSSVPSVTQRHVRERHLLEPQTDGTAARLLNELGPFRIETRKRNPMALGRGAVATGSLVHRGP